MAAHRRSRTDDDDIFLEGTVEECEEKMHSALRRVAGKVSKQLLHAMGTPDSHQ